MEKAREKARNTRELQQQYDALVQQFDSINQSRKPRTLSWSFTESTGIVKELAELQDSPRSLMHSLQGPLRKYDLALFTPLRERRAAIESGRLKGRKLFDREEEHDHVMVEETEVRSVFSYDSDDENDNDDDKETLLPRPYYCHSSSSSSSSFVCDECMKKEAQAVEEEEEVVMEKDHVEDESFGAKTVKERRWTLTMVLIWLAIGILLVAIDFVSMSFLAGDRQRGDMILVPT